MQQAPHPVVTTLMLQLSVLVQLIAVDVRHIQWKAQVVWLHTHSRVCRMCAELIKLSLPKFVAFLATYGSEKDLSVLLFIG